MVTRRPPGRLSRANQLLSGYPMMFRLTMIGAVALISLTLLAPACKSTSSGGATPSREFVTVARRVGSWEGTGNKTIGFVSETGCFRVNWKTRNQQAAENGTFRLTVRSAISGRPIQIIADHQGPGSGTVDFKDDPRMYDFLVDSTNTKWAFTVEELYDVDANKAPSVRRGK